MKIYWDNVSDVDHAILFPFGQIVGNSYIAQATAEGNNNNEEAVILDFSTGKKQLKAVCDKVVDHKLWVNDRYHKIEYTNDSVIIKARNKNLEYVFETMLPKDAIFVQSFFVDDDVDPFKTLNSYIEKAVQLANEDLSEIASTPEMKVTISDNKKVFLGSKHKHFFRYTHGLPTSTSYGCQNICHGHLSYVELTPKEGAPSYLTTRNKAKRYLCDIFDSMGVPIYYNPRTYSEPSHLYYGERMVNIHFICPTVCVEQYENKGEDGVEYSIKTNTRGYMLNKIKFDPDNLFYGMVELDTLSTIENLGAFFKAKIEQTCPDVLKYFDVKISEGLSKGVCL